MTRKEAVVIQKAIRENLHETDKDFPYRDEMIPVMKESCDMAIKALEQEPILEKIRAEIMKLQTYKMFEGENTVYIERDDVLQIIDKYKAESVVV